MNNITKLTTGYNSIGHLKGSRLGEGERCIDDSMTRKFTESFPKDKKCILFVEEKMDGSNCSVIRLKGEIRAVTRTGYDCAQSNYEQHKMFHRWVIKNKEKFEKLLPHEEDRCIGEWMALAHGTIYKDLASPYMIFDLYRTNYSEFSFYMGTVLFHAGPDPVRFPLLLRKQLVEECGLVNVPLVYQAEKPISIAEALALVNDNSEGVIYRLECINKKYAYSTPYMIGKVVKQNKVDGCFLKENIYNWTE